VNNSIDI